LKVDIQEWLTEHEIAWDSSATKADLLELVAAATAPEPEPAAEPEAEGGEV
jgi:hypothetical protein